MTIAPMTAQDMNAAEIPAMPFMRPEDEELETLRSDICGVMYDMMGIAPLHSLYRFVAAKHHTSASEYTEDAVLNMIAAQTLSPKKGNWFGNGTVVRGLPRRNLLVNEMYSRVSRLGLQFIAGMDAGMDAEELRHMFLFGICDIFGLDGWDVLEIWCRMESKALPKTVKRQNLAIKRLVKGGFKQFMQCIEMAALDANEERGIF